MRNNYKKLTFLVYNGLRYLYFSLAVFTGIIAISLSVFVAWFALFSGKMIISGNPSIAYILVVDVILYFITFWFFSKKKNKEYEIRKMNTIYNGYNIAATIKL